MITEEASFADNLVGNIKTTTMSEGGNINEGVVNVGPILHYDVSHPHYFQLVLGPLCQSPELLPPQQLSGERITPGEKYICGGTDECCIHSIKVKNGQRLHSQ